MIAGTLRADTRAALLEAGLDADDVVAVISRGLAEDLGSAGDITSVATVDAAAVTTVRYVARESGVAAGLPILHALADLWLEAAADLKVLVHDGDRLAAGDVLADLTANTRRVLAMERLSLNLLGHLSGIATATRRWTEAIAGTSARIRDTRKTTPGLRDLEKYAVRCGGGVNHRRGLDDAVLIKDNHIAGAQGVGTAIDRVRAAYAGRAVTIQVEVDDLDQLTEALAHGARDILLDNFDVPTLQRAVELTRAIVPDVRLEASGGLRLDKARSVAQTGVTYLAVGELTHSARNLDIALDTATGGPPAAN